MKTFWFQSDDGNIHRFDMKKNTFTDILAEFGSIEVYLKSLGVHFITWGIN